MTDQADNLRSRMKKSEENRPLPPRKDAHEKRRKSVNWKINGPILRIFLLVFGLAIVLFVFSNGWYEKVMPMSKEELQVVSNNDIQKRETNLNQSPERSEIMVTEDKKNESQQNTDNDSSDTSLEEEKMKDKDVADQSEAENMDYQVTEDNDTKEFDILYHTVGDNETLFSISKKYYGSRVGERYIQEWNHLKGTQVLKGQVLKIPIPVK